MKVNRSGTGPSNHLATVDPMHSAPLSLALDRNVAGNEDLSGFSLPGAS